MWQRLLEVNSVFELQFTLGFVQPILILVMARHFQYMANSHVRTAGAQVSLRPHTVWPGPSLCPQWVVKGPSLHAHNEDHDQAERILS